MPRYLGFHEREWYSVFSEFDLGSCLNVGLKFKLALMDGDVMTDNHLMVSDLREVVGGQLFSASDCSDCPTPPPAGNSKCVCNPRYNGNVNCNKCDTYKTASECTTKSYSYCIWSGSKKPIVPPNPTDKGTKIKAVWYGQYVGIPGLQSSIFADDKDGINTLINFGTGGFYPEITEDILNGNNDQSAWSKTCSIKIFSPYFDKNSNKFSDNIQNVWWTIGGSNAPAWNDTNKFITQIKTQIKQAYDAGYNGICLDIEQGLISGDSINQIYQYAKTIKPKNKTILVTTGTMFGMDSNTNLNGCESHLDYVMFMNYRNGGDTGTYITSDYSKTSMNYYINALKNGTNPRKLGSNNYGTGNTRFPKVDPSSHLINCWSFGDNTDHCTYVKRYDGDYQGTAYWYVSPTNKISKTCI
jgi:hypothetical protein